MHKFYQTAKHKNKLVLTAIILSGFSSESEMENDMIIEEAP